MTEKFMKGVLVIAAVLTFLFLCAYAMPARSAEIQVPVYSAVVQPDQVAMAPRWWWSKPTPPVVTPPVPDACTPAACACNATATSTPAACNCAQTGTNEGGRRHVVAKIGKGTLRIATAPIRFIRHRRDK